MSLYHSNLATMQLYHRLSVLVSQNMLIAMSLITYKDIFTPPLSCLKVN